jgi:hypothetical protein
MAQSAVTVTNENPTPPTNISSIGLTPPNPTNYLAAVYGPPPTLPPFFDDGIAAPSGSYNETGSPLVPLGTVTTFAAAHALVSDSTGKTSAAPEGAGNETLFTQSYNPAVLVPIPLKTVGCGPALTVGVLPSPNQLAGSSLSPATNPALTSITPGSTVSGVGNTTLTATGTNFTPQSVVYVNGVAQTTVFASSTSLTCASVTKKTSAGPWPVTVVTAGAVSTAPQTWTFT